MIVFQNKIKILLLLVMTSLLILSGCGSGSDLGIITSTEQVETVSSGGEGVPSNPTDLEEPASSDGEVDAGYSLGYSLGGPDLRSTDPSTVSLASGEIQLVEFFAYW